MLGAVERTVIGCFHYARLTDQRPVELTKGKWNDIAR